MEKFLSLYKSKIVQDLQQEFKYLNKMQTPKLLKITLNMGVGGAVRDKKELESAFNDMTLISGQKPIYTRVRKANAAFKIRDEMMIGCKVTLRKNMMYEFLERLVLITLPRSKDFKGFSKKSFDGNGNFSFGIKEQIAFLEIDYDKVDKIRGLDVSIMTSAKSDKEAMKLLEGFHFPFLN